MWLENRAVCEVTDPLTAGFGVLPWPESAGTVTGGWSLIGALLPTGLLFGASAGVSGTGALLGIEIGSWTGASTGVGSSAANNC